MRTGAVVVLATVAIGAVAYAWFEQPPHLSADDAVAATEDAFAAAGLEATVDAHPVATTYASRTRAPVEVWSVIATVRDEPVQLQLARATARPVAIDDRALAGDRYVLSELEYESVASHVDNPALQRTVGRNITVTFAAVLVVGTALGSLALATPKEIRP